MGLTLGALIIEAGVWRWVFIVNRPIGLFTVIIGRAKLTESPALERTIPSMIGVVLVGGSLTLLTLGIVESDSWGWTNPTTIIALGIGASALAAFVVHQSQSKRPTIDIALFAIRDFRWSNLATLAFGIGFSGTFLSSVLFLNDVWNYSILRAGLSIAPGPFIVFLLASRLGRLAAKIGQCPLIIGG